MRAAIHSPYLDTLGGGERYVMSVARVLSERGWIVDVESSDSGILKKLERRFDWKLDNVNVVSDIKRGVFNSQLMDQLDQFGRDLIMLYGSMIGLEGRTTREVCRAIAHFMVEFPKFNQPKIRRPSDCQKP